MKKSMLSFFLVILSCFAVGFSVSAEEMEDKDVFTTEDFTSKYQLVDETTGETFYFQNEEDYKMHKELMELDGNTLFMTKKTKVSSLRKNMLWIGYHSGTKNWSLSDGYTLKSGKSYSASGSYTYAGFTINTGFTYTNSVTTHIPANPSRWSRLGMWGDFTFTKWKISTYGQGRWHSYYTASKVRHNKYIKPRYK